MQPSINKRIRKCSICYFLVDDVIHDVIHSMNLGTKYKITNFIVFSKA